MLAKIFGAKAEEVQKKYIEDMKASLVDFASISLMISDLQGNIIYCNKSVEELLRKNEKKIQEKLPSFRVDKIVGSNFDQYHKNPSHQQSILSNPDNLPYESEITLAGLTFRLSAFALKNPQGTHIGNAVQWEDVTESKELQSKVGQMASVIKSSTISILMADMDGEITYVNPSLIKMFKARDRLIREEFPAFNPDELIGENIDIFNKYPRLQSEILFNEEKLPHKTKIDVAGIEFRLTAFALKNDEGERVGSCIQWEDLMSNNEIADYAGQIEAIGKSNAVIEFNMDGTIITANENFLNAMGYSLEELKGQHHRIFVDEEYRNSTEYRQFWESLNQGRYDTGEFRRIGKGGKEVWIQASYNPIRDMNGKPFKVVKYAIDITKQKQESVDFEGQLEAISRSNSIIEFDMDGNILEANNNFLNNLGYTNDEIKGRHHSMFVEPEYRSSQEYREFWERLNKGEYFTNEFKQIGKNGKEVWMQASYNPIFDLNGKPYKVVSYAVNITDKKKAVLILKESLTSLASGDLTKRIDKEVDKDFVELKEALNDTLEQITNMVVSIVEASENVSTSAKEISQGNTDLSQRTEEQASSLEETASSMEELTTTVKKNAENSKEANKIAYESMKDAEQGGEVVGRAINAMKEIDEASKKISDIIGVIDEIAFQTNLLALNASVEAARAGDQGRGFAVVASEVRNLAQRSAGAAKEIKELIEDSVAKVSEGTRLVDESGDTLNEIVKSVSNVSKITANIDSASEEQAAGITQVNEAVNQMDEMTQQNAALVEQAAASAESLEEQSSNLLEMMKFFNTGRDVTISSAVRTPIKNKAKKAASKASPRKSTVEIDKDDEWEEF